MVLVLLLDVTLGLVPVKGELVQMHHNSDTNILPSSQLNFRDTVSCVVYN